MAVFVPCSARNKYQPRTWTAITSLVNVSWAFAKYAQPGADERDMVASIQPPTMGVQNFAS